LGHEETRAPQQTCLLNSRGPFDTHQTNRVGASIAAPVRLELSVIGDMASKSSEQGFALDQEVKK
jgi:hypothetical protein